MAQQAVPSPADDMRHSGFTENQWKCVHAACLRRLANWHLAEEATQAVFILTLRKHDARHALAENSGWLMRAADLVCRETLRRERRRRHHEHVAAKSTDAVKSSSSFQNDDSRNLESDLNVALESLSDCDRTILQQRFFASQPYRSIGERLGLSEAAVEKRVSRALSRMRQIMKSNGIDVSADALSLLLYAGIEAGSAGAPLVRHFHFTRESRTLAKKVLRKLAWKKAVLAAAVIAAVLIFFPGSQNSSQRSAAAVASPPSPPALVAVKSEERQATTAEDVELPKFSTAVEAHGDTRQSQKAAALKSNRNAGAGKDDGAVIAMRDALPPECVAAIVPTPEKIPATVENDEEVIAAASGAPVVAAKPAAVASNEAIPARGVIVKGIELNMDTDSSIARSEITFTFENRSDKAAEFSFVFALPEHAAADRFAISDTSDGHFVEGAAAYVANARATYTNMQNGLIPAAPITESPAAFGVSKRSANASAHPLVSMTHKCMPEHKPIATWAEPAASLRELAELLVQAELPPAVTRRKWERLQQQHPDDPLAGVLERIDGKLYRLTISSIPPWRTRKAVVSCVQPLELEAHGADLRLVYRFPFLDLNQLPQPPALHFHGALRDVDNSTALNAPPGAVVSRTKTAATIDVAAVARQPNFSGMRVEFSGGLGRLLAAGDCVFKIHRPDANATSEGRFSLTLPPVMPTVPERKPSAAELQHAEVTVTAVDGSVLKTVGQPSAAAALPLDHCFSLYGICSAGGPVTVTLTGTLGGVPFRREWSAVLPAMPVRHSALAKLWARAQEGQIESTQAAFQQHIINGPVAFVVAPPGPGAQSRTTEVKSDSGNAELIAGKRVK